MFSLESGRRHLLYQWPFSHLFLSGLNISHSLFQIHFHMLNHSSQRCLFLNRSTMVQRSKSLTCWNIRAGLWKGLWSRKLQSSFSKVSLSRVTLHCMHMQSVHSVDWYCTQQFTCDVQCTRRSIHNLNHLAPSFSFKMYWDSPVPKPSHRLIEICGEPPKFCL